MFDRVTFDKALDDLLHRKVNSKWLSMLLLGAGLIAAGIAFVAMILRMPSIGSPEVTLCMALFGGAGLAVVEGVQMKKRQSSLVWQVALVRERFDAILDELVRRMREGGKGYEYLVSEGVKDPELRKFMIEAAKLRVNGEGC
ncbi:MAG: hypothetical protein L6R28_22605 [Planctomycetes bacterium]|nr:hypothetical protein [Planctomycetota bacterium]